MARSARQFVRPNLVQAELQKLKLARDYTKWQLQQLEEAISWAEKGVIPQGTPTLQLPRAATNGNSDPNRPSIKVVVRNVLADHKPHTQEAVISAVKTQLGEEVRVPAIIAALRGKGITRREDNSYILTAPVKEVVRRRA